MKCARRLFHGLLLGTTLLGGLRPALSVSPESGVAIPASFFEKARVTIAVTDSGLGGMGILAEAAARMEKAGVFERADFVFFNALFSNEGGYNALPSTGEKVRVFDRALEALAREVRPDLILIGCNTLSVIYPRTEFAGKTDIPVLGIVETGTALMAEALRRAPGSSVILFGTPTTVGEAAYQENLAALGFAEGRVIAQACPDLEAFIEKDPASDETALLIAGYAAEALSRLGDPSAPFAVSLNCTHYGLSRGAWEEAFAGEGERFLGILNPNSGMLDPLFPAGKLGRHARTEVGVRVLSMVEIPADKIAAVGRVLEKTSPAAARALSDYELKPGLFEFK
jgi:glutamate racemase